MSKKIIIQVVIFTALFSLNATEGIEENEKPPFSLSPSAVYLIEEAYLDSINILKNELEITPNNELMLSELGELQVKSKLMEDAFLTYSRLIRVNPRNYDACLFLGYSYYVKGKNLLQYEDEKYKQIEKPQKIQHAIHQNKIREILGREYKLALQYLSISTSIIPVTFVQDIVKEVQHRILNPNLSP